MMSLFQLLGTPNEKIWLGYKDLPGVQKMKFVDNPVSHLREKVSSKCFIKKREPTSLPNKFL